MRGAYGQLRAAAGASGKPSALRQRAPRGAALPAAACCKLRARQCLAPPALEAAARPPTWSSAVLSTTVEASRCPPTLASSQSYHAAPRGPSSSRPYAPSRSTRSASRPAAESATTCCARRSPSTKPAQLGRGKGLEAEGGVGLGSGWIDQVWAGLTGCELTRFDWGKAG